MVLLFVLASFTTFASGDETESLARSTGNEEIIISVTGDYYDRDSDITVTITSKNLDPNSEYTLTWELCGSNNWYTGCDIQQYVTGDASPVADPAEYEGTEDIGSGNMIQITTFTFSDPGLVVYTPDQTGNTEGTWEGIHNGSYRFDAVLSIQGVPLATNDSSYFALGGEVLDSSFLDTNDNILKNTVVTFSGRIYLDSYIRGVLNFDVDCGLFEDGVTAAVDSFTLSGMTSWDSDFYFSGGNNASSGNVLTPTATSGTHHIECSVTRLVDNTLMHTIVGNDFEVIDADTTGLEELTFQIPSTVYYDRTTSSATTQVTVSVDFVELYVGETYTFNWELCGSNNWYTGCDIQQYVTGDASPVADPAEYEGEITFTPTTATHTETFTFDDPGLVVYTPDQTGNTEGTWEGIYNGSYRFYGELDVQEVPLATNDSSYFALGGEVLDSSFLDTNDNILKNTVVTFSGRIYLDSYIRGVLNFDVDCGLFEDGVTAAVDSFTLSGMTSWDNDFYFSGGNNASSGNVLTPTATSGTHHIECSVTRLVDNTLMHTIVGNDFEVIDADTTGLEELTFQIPSTVYYDRTTSSATTQVTVSVDFVELYVGETYTFNWELCGSNNWYTGCDIQQYVTGDASPVADPAEYEGEITFTPTTATHTETFTFDDPGLVVYTPDQTGNTEGTWEGIYNGSYRFYGELDVQEVPLATNDSSYFALGGEVLDSSFLDTNDNILKNTVVTFSGRIYLDSYIRGVLNFDVDCGLFEDGVTAAVDSFTLSGMTSWDNDFYFSGGNNASSGNVLTPTATSGTHHIECSVTRLVDNTLMHTIVGNDFEVIDDTSNQDDASMAVSVAMHATEGWGTVTITAIDLDPGQEYRFDWVVEDNAASPATVMMQNDHIWVAGNDGTHTYDLPFHDLADTTDACIIVVFKAGTTELATDSSVCWISASTADGDGDGVYDKNDLCENTPAGATVQTDGCSDSDGDGVDSTIETECGSDPNDINSVPTDLDNDGTCDLLDADADGDGALNVDEIAAGTDPMDANSFPSNMLPTCAVYYSLEVDGMPTSFEGDAAIPALSGATAQAGVSSLTPPVITVPAGSYYITAHCIDTDGDDITVTVNDITVGPIAGEVSAGAIIVIGEDVDETLDVTVSWTDGTDTLTAIITVNMDGDSGTTVIPGFGFTLGMMSIMLAGFVALRREQE